MILQSGDIYLRFKGLPEHDMRSIPTCFLLESCGSRSVYTWLSTPRNVDRCPAHPESPPRNADRPRKKAPCRWYGTFAGGLEGIRTLDLLFRRQTLYPLSYEPETSLALRQATVLLYTIPLPTCRQFRGIPGFTRSRTDYTGVVWTSP